MNFYPMFFKGMLIFKQRLLSLGYLFSSVLLPVLYLITFGLGLGRGIKIDQVPYLIFIIPGICAISSMTNSYTWIAASISIGKLHFKTYDEYMASPLRALDIMMGEVLAGVVRGLFASSLVIIAGVILGGYFPKSPTFLLPLILNCLIFASIGVISGFLAKSHEDTATFSNLFIIPMGFFCGTFFPIDNLPISIRAFLYILPLTHASKSLRESFLGNNIEIVSLLVMLTFFLALFFVGIIIIKRSNR